MSTQRFVFVSLALAFVGCECRPQGTTGISGEVRWEWVSPLGGTEGQSFARIDFPATAMGSRREQPLTIRNVGRAPFTMAQFALLMGATATYNGQGAPNSAFDLRFQPDLQLNPTDSTTVIAAFTPPITEGSTLTDYESYQELRPQGANPSPLTLTGRAIAGQCDVPSVIDFGSVPLRSTRAHRVDLRNDGAAPIVVVAGGVTGAPVGIFTFDGLDMNNRLTVAPNTAPGMNVLFTPEVPGDFNGEFTLKRSESCPQRVVKVTGRGVESCITWKSQPTDDQGITLHFGAVAPGATGPGKITFINACSIDAELSNLRTSDAVFTVTAATPGDLTKLVVPAATRDAMGMWSDGQAPLELAFQPTVLGVRTGQLQTNTSLSSQPGLGVPLKGFGGGPRIQVTPAPVFAIGRVGFTPNAMPGSYVQRALRVANVGNRPPTPDPLANLHLGDRGTGGTYYEKHAINGTDDELCVGEWDTANGRCTNTLSAALYDQAVGIEASPTRALNLPVRVIPATAGPKEWEIVIFSNDSTQPEVHVRVTADAVEVPPCNYSLMPTNLQYGLMTAPQTKDLSFTLTNLGTAPTEVCYFNGIGLSPTSDAAYSIVSNPVDLMLNAGQSTSVVVRAAPTQAPATPTTLNGAVEFSVSTPGASQATVLLRADLTPACLTITPSPATFLDTQLDCGSPEKAVLVTNSCATPVTFSNVSITDAATVSSGTGSCTTAAGCPQFVLTSAPPAGAILPGASRTVLVRFRPYVTGPVTGEMTFSLTQGGQPLVYNVPLSGNGVPRTMATCGVTAVCPGPMTVNANSTVRLTPTIMAPGAVSCAWTAASRPTTSNGTFTTPTSCTGTSYFADVVGTHLVQFNVSDGAGGNAQCTTPITVTANGDLWIELTWDRPNDMDMHLLHPTAGPATSVLSWFDPVWDCNYRNTSPDWLAGAQADPSLDRDDIVGQGPENTRINTPQPNVTYTIGIHMYSWSASPSPVTSTVKLYCGGTLITTQTKTLNRVKDMWLMGTVRFSGGSGCTYAPLGNVINVP